MKTWASRRYPERHVYGRGPGTVGSVGGLGNLIILHQRSATILSFPEPPVSGSSELLYFLLLFSFLFSICHCWLTIMEMVINIMVLLVLGMHGTCIAGFAELPRGWAGESLGCLSAGNLSPKLLSFLKLPYERGSECTHGRDANAPPPFSNTQHMDLVKGCFYIFLYKASFVFLPVGMGLILVSFTLLSTGSNPSEARI